ncbi:hypothetical protein VB779_01695 [Haloarculaceae archaeon H-GB11]|nr:hypothetical protein [Haloarculaceae archaeon H-GB11]
MSSPALAASATAGPGNETAVNSTAFGTELSAFMQANAGESEDAVDDGLWEANHESNGTTNVAARTETLSRRLQRLQSQSQRLESRHENGSMSEVAYRAQASRIAAKLDALHRAVNDTETRAAAANRTVSNLSGIRTEATELGNGDIAAATSGLQSVRKGKTGPPESAVVAAAANGTGQPAASSGSNAGQRGTTPPRTVRGMPTRAPLRRR